MLCRVRYKLSYRDVAEYFLLRGFKFTHETVRDWEERFLPLFTDQIRTKRTGKVGKIWKVDETYIPKRELDFQPRPLEWIGVTPLTLG